jgi:hypothetical protein
MTPDTWFACAKRPVTDLSSFLCQKGGAMKILIADKVSTKMVADLEALGCEVALAPDLSVEALPSAITGVEILIVRSKRGHRRQHRSGTLAVADRPRRRRRQHHRHPKGQRKRHLRRQLSGQEHRRRRRTGDRSPDRRRPPPPEVLDKTPSEALMQRIAGAEHVIQAVLKPA